MGILLRSCSKPALWREIDRKENWGLRSDAEWFVDEARLADEIGFSHPPHSSFSNHVNRFDALQCPYINFVDPIGLVGRLQIRTAAPIDFCRIGLHPPPNAPGIHFRPRPPNSSATCSHASGYRKY